MSAEASPQEQEQKPGPQWENVYFIAVDEFEYLVAALRKAIWQRLLNHLESRRHRSMKNRIAA